MIYNSFNDGERGRENKLKFNENREENMICCTNSL